MMGPTAAVAAAANRSADMAVLVTAEAPGQTAEGYQGMLTALEGAMRQAPGFILHGAFAVDGGWRVVELWDSKAEADTWYAKQVAPHLPPGVRPKRTVQTLDSLVRTGG
jgi:hypothetical protein